MQFRVLSLVLGAMVASTVGFQVPALAVVPGTSHSIAAPSNSPNKTVPSNVNKAMMHLKAAYSAAAKAHADVVDGRYADASSDIKSARQHLDSAAKIRRLPRNLAHTISRLNAQVPQVEQAINNQMASARIQTGRFVTAMNHNINGLTLATTSPLGGGAGPMHKKPITTKGQPPAKAPISKGGY